MYKNYRKHTKSPEINITRCRPMTEYQNNKNVAEMTLFNYKKSRSQPPNDREYSLMIQPIFKKIGDGIALYHHQYTHRYFNLLTVHDILDHVGSHFGLNSYPDQPKRKKPSESQPSTYGDWKRLRNSNTNNVDNDGWENENEVVNNSINDSGFSSTIPTGWDAGTEEIYPKERNFRPTVDREHELMIEQLFKIMEDSFIQFYQQYARTCGISIFDFIMPSVEDILDQIKNYFIRNRIPDRPERKKQRATYTYGDWKRMRNSESSNNPPVLNFANDGWDDEETVVNDSTKSNNQVKDSGISAKTAIASGWDDEDEETSSKSPKEEFVSKSTIGLRKPSNTNVEGDWSD